MKIEKLFPPCKDNVWGGTRLIEKYGKITDKRPCAESWELSFHKDGKTCLSNGKTLEESATKEELGVNCEGFPFFPVLVKFIDAKSDLSVQVHPSDDYALKNENSFGKTEMWYIVDADEGTGIYLGFKKDVTMEEYEKAIKENTLCSLLNFFKVKKGECYFIPSGTIHAIGAGCLISEIQQNSNLTYRVYDYGRRDKNGNLRELHVEKALKVTNLKKYVYSPVCLTLGGGSVIGLNKYFTGTKVVVNGRTELSSDKNSFRAVSCTEGQGVIDGQEIKAGDTYFVPATYGTYVLEGNLTAVITEIRKFRYDYENGTGRITDDLFRTVAEEKAETEETALCEVLKKTGLTEEDLER